MNEQNTHKFQIAPISGGIVLKLDEQCLDLGSISNNRDKGKRLKKGQRYLSRYFCQQGTVSDRSRNNTSMIKYYTEIMLVYSLFLHTTVKVYLFNLYLLNVSYNVRTVWSKSRTLFCNHWIMNCIVKHFLIVIFDSLKM